MEMRATLRRHALSPVNIDAIHTANSRPPHRFRHGHNNGSSSNTKPLSCAQHLAIEKLSSTSVYTFQHITLKFVSDDLQPQSWVTTQFSSTVCLPSLLFANLSLTRNATDNTLNGRTADIAITSHGSDFYFAICAAMGFASCCFIGLALRKQRRDRVFHYITASVVFVACIAYFTMGSNLGFAPIAVEFSRPGDPEVRGRYRAIYYVRYIDWFITTPLLLLDLLLTAGMPWPTILFTIIIDEIMIVTGLVGALVQSRYKWGFFVFGCVALAYIVYQLAWESRKHARAYGRDVEKAFLYCGSLTTLLCKSSTSQSRSHCTNMISGIIYPIAWGVCEGANLISPDSEAVFYGVLDFLAKPIFGALLLWGHKNIDPARLGLAIKDYDGDAIVHEKRHPEGPAAGAVPHNGHHDATTAVV
jgi:bacteriorhodopsin